MRRAKLLLIGFGFAALIVAAALFMLLATPAGPRALKPKIERELSQAVGYKVSIGAIDGPLAAMRIRDIAFSDNQGVFLTLDAASIGWRPARAFARDYVVDSIEVDGGDLRRKPVSEDRDETFKGITLPTDLPRISVHSLAVSRMRVAHDVSGRASILSARGSAQLGDDAINVSFRLSSEGARDDIGIEARTRGARATLNARVVSSPDGVIAALAGTDGAIDVTVSGEGALSAFDLRADGALGATAAIALAANADLADFSSIAVRGSISPGDGLAVLREHIGPRADIDIAIAPHSNGAELAINRVAGAFGVLAGSAQWRNDSDRLARAAADLRLEISADFRPGLTQRTGRDIRALAALEPMGRDWRLSLDATSETGTLAFDHARTDLRSRIAGAGRLSVAPSALLPALLASGFSASGDFDVDSAGDAVARGLQIRTRSGSAFTGKARYGFAARAAAIDGEAAISSADARRAAPGLDLGAPLRMSLVASGGMQRFTAAIQAAVPAFAWKGGRVGALALKIDAAGAVGGFTGAVSARRADGQGRLDARFSRGPGAAFSIQGLDYRGRGFALAGAAVGDFGARRLRADLAYKGAADAEPWPGLRLSGDAQLRADISPDAAGNSIEIDAPLLQSSGWSVEGLSVIATGPINAMEIAARAAGATAGSAFSARTIDSTLIADLRRAPQLSISTLTLELGGEPVALRSPAQIDFGEEVAIRSLSASVGSRGSIELSGALAPNRWRADLKTTRLPIGDGSAAASVEASLDTARAEPARGNFAIRSLLTPDRRAVEGSFVWSGVTVHLVDAGRDPAIDFEIIVPARLVRRPTIAVDSRGAVSGLAAYDGPLEIIAPLLPSFAQSINGRARVEARISGSTLRPAVNGVLDITDATYTELSSGLSLIDIDARAEAVGSIDGTRIAFTGDAAGPGQARKTISVAGGLRLADDWRLEATITLAGANLPAAPITELIADGALSLAGPIDALSLSGEIVAQRLAAELVPPETVGLVDIDVVATDRPAPTAAARTRKRATPIALEIRARAPSRAMVRGRGLESEWRADLTIAGDAASPLVLGSLTLIEGRLDFSGRRFEIEEGVMQFDRLVANDPLIRIVAAVQTDGVVARIKIAGRASSPQISLESTPALPTEDIVARMLFGKPASELSAIESLQAAQALANLGAIGPFGGGEGVAGSARRAIGLDLLSIDLEADTGASSLTVGKYLTDDIFVSAKQDARGQNGAIRVEFEVTNSISLETEIKQDGEQTVSANWKKDF